MLNRDQIELIHREIDGANTPEESAACRSLMEENAEAREEEAALRHVARLFDRVEEREPPSHLKQAILDSLRLRPGRRLVHMFVTPLELQEAGRLTNARPDKMLLSNGDRVYLEFSSSKRPKRWPEKCMLAAVTQAARSQEVEKRQIPKRPSVR